VEIFENAAPENPPIASQVMIATTANQSALRPFTDFLFTEFTLT
jgi:hypothetical protein